MLKKKIITSVINVEIADDRLVTTGILVQINPVSKIIIIGLNRWCPVQKCRHIFQSAKRTPYARLL